MNQSKDSHMIPMTSLSSGKGYTIRPDLYYYTNKIVNVIFIGEPGKGGWTLIDAGMPNSGGEIIEVAETRFGKDTVPDAIILTHGHFDHVGSIVHLLDHWKNVPVYAHPDEFPFLTGQKPYPDPDPTVEGGMLAKISSFYPHEPINIEEVLRPLPEDHTLPNLSEWQWIHTPGHSPGHVSFYRAKDKVLVAGDAFVTVRVDSFFKVLLQKEEVNGPPRYFTTDWDLAKDSVIKLAALHPNMAITGHGHHMEGEVLHMGLQHLAFDFDHLALPKYGKYVHGQDV
jgi:glyoxylase-like metal-dependent hydrolase (beta-lactamase superfamily II)